MSLQEQCRRISSWAVHRPRRALLLWAVASVLPLPGLFFLRTDTDGGRLVPREDPVVKADNAIRERFHLRDQLIVAIETDRPEGIFNPSTLGAVRAITELLRAQPEVGISHVSSLGTEKRDRLVPGSSSSFVSFLEPFPSSPTEWMALRRDLAAPPARVYEGVLVSRDRRTAAVLAGLESGGEVDRREVYRRVEKAIHSLAAGDGRIRLVGAPAAEALLGDSVLQDLAHLIPLSIVLLGVVLWLGTRRAACVAIALGKAGLCIVWTFAVMACCGMPVYLTTAVLPVVLATMSIADEVHLLMRFQEALPGAVSPRAAVERTVGELMTPVVLATTTTAVGFLSFLSSPIEPVRAFGLGASLGIVYSLAFSLLVTPALLAQLPARLLLRRERAGRYERLSPLLRLLEEAVRRPVWALGAMAALTLAAGIGMARLAIHDSWIESFAPGSPFRRDTEAVNRSLNGTHLLHVALRFRISREDDPPCIDPRVIRRLGELEDFLRREPRVGGALGLHGQLSALSSFWNPTEDPHDVLGRSREIVRLLHRYELSPGLFRRRQVIDDTFDETIVTVFLKNANYRDTQALMDRVGAWHRRHLAPLGAGLEYAGDVAVSQATIPAIVRTQVFSLPIALLGVFAVIAFLYRSPLLALAALFPVSLSAVWLLGVLGWAGIPLGVATSMFFAIVLGLGVDSQSIHFLDRYQKLRAAGADRIAERTLGEVGPAIAVNTLAVAAGFGLLMISSVPANARLGLLITCALVLGALFTLAGLGSLLELGERVAHHQPQLSERREP